jgi:hypothetical protein
MTDKDKCNLILEKMREVGYTDVESTCEGWTLDDIEYFLANYETPYLMVGEF